MRDLFTRKHPLLITKRLVKQLNTRETEVETEWLASVWAKNQAASQRDLYKIRANHMTSNQVYSLNFVAHELGLLIIPYNLAKKIQTQPPEGFILDFLHLFNCLNL